MEECREISMSLLNKMSHQPGFNLSTYFEKFDAMETNLDRVNFIYNDLNKFSAFPRFKVDEKSDAIAVRLRIDGNTLFVQENFIAALNCYTSSILTAETKEIEALAYANRSAVLYTIGLLEDCITDIDRAFTNGYPDKLKKKLIHRQGMSRLLLQNVPRPTPPYEKIDNFKESEKNKFIQSAKNCVEIMTNKKFGRYVVARRNIKVGEILAVEKAFATRLDDNLFVYCHRCLKLCYCMIPCDRCTQALYCGDKCKRKAFEEYHQYECPLLFSIRPLADTTKLLALKIVFLARHEMFQKKSPAVRSDIYRSDRLYEILQLKTHLEKRDSRNIYSRAAIAAGFVYLIKNYTTFLQDGFDEDCLKEKLLQMILICGTNTGYIMELHPQRQGIFEHGSFALGMFPFLNIFNHSCYNNVIASYHGSSVVLRATNTIKKGEQCFILYEGITLSAVKEYRQGFLSDTKFFTCTCQACQENWIIHSVLDITPQPLFVEKCLAALRCSSNLAKGASVDMVNNNLAGIIRKIEKLETKLPPTDYCVILRISLKMCYNILGNKRRI